MNKTEAVERYKWLVVTLAQEYLRKGIEFDDLKQVGYIGLIKAVDEWRLNAGALFTTYANERIRDEMRRLVVKAKKDVGWERISAESYESDEGPLTPEQLIDPPKQEADVELSGKLASLRLALKRLRSDDQELLGLLANGDSHPAIAERKKIPRGTVRDRCNRALARLHDAVRMAS